jgi:hypothetical protein
MERRTSNIERPTSNNVFCQYKKRLSNTRRKRLRLRPVSLRKASGLEALHERIYPSKFDSAAFDGLKP